jgi:hypothetical protein
MNFILQRSTLIKSKSPRKASISVWFLGVAQARVEEPLVDQLTWSVTTRMSTHQLKRGTLTLATTNLVPDTLIHFLAKTTTEIISAITTKKISPKSTRTSKKRWLGWRSVDSI